MAIAAGASGVGVGSAINRLDSEVEMVAVVQRLREAIQAIAPARTRI
jgi:putative ribosome biogenesis GTPase RsgA